MHVTAPPTAVLRPHVPHLLVEWLHEGGDVPWRQVDGTLAFVDISGFTRLTERLARRGKVGAEEMSDVLDSCFGRLLDVAAAEGADLLKWGGDAVLLLFRGPGHAERACRAAAGMRAALRAIGTVRTSAGTAVLRMSVGIHSGTFDLFLVGRRHRELLLTGPAATCTAQVEAAASAGQIVVSAATAALLPARLLGAECGPGRLLRGLPDAVEAQQPDLSADGLDLGACLAEPLRRHLMEDARAAEHRRIAVSFLWFSGVDGVLAERGPDALADRLGALVEAVQEAAHGEAVTFLESDIAEDGGKLMLIAGAPASQGDDEERMLRTLRAVLDEDFGLSLRAGANAGGVFAGGFGPAFRRTYSVKGDAVNLAARLAGRAGAGELLATDAVLRPSRTRFATRALAPFTVKGKSLPVEAFAVAEQLAAAPASSHAGPLVGREQELAVLREALRQARAGAGRVVQIIGEPGIGKSRLVAELLPAAEQCEVVIATSERYAAATPYATVERLLRRALRLDAAEGPRLLELLTERMEHLTPESVPWLPLVAGALGASVPDTPETAALEQRFRKELLEETLCDLLAAALAGPALIVLDDAHIMDPASAATLERLFRDLERRPWLICVTRRDRPGGFTLPDGLPSVELRPGPLPAAAATELVQASLDDRPLPPHVAKALAERAGGNPLFLVELVAGARAGTVGDTVPESIEALLTAQIDALAARDRDVLRRAAVLGTAFDETVLRAILEDGTTLDARVWHRLSGFVEPDREGGHRFRHALIRDAAYERLPFRVRRELHERAGAAIERLAQGDDQAQLLSLHYFHARRYPDAWHHARIAGERAAAMYANVEAVHLYERALGAARMLPDVPAPELAAVHEAVGDLRERLGEFAAAGQSYGEGRRLLRADRIGRARLLLKQARIPERLGRYSEALAWTRRGLRTLQGDTTPAALQQRAQLTVWRAAILQAQGRHAQAVRWCWRAIAAAEAAGDRDALAHAYFLLDWAYVDLGRLEEATHSHLALAIYEELGDLGRQAVVCNNLGGWAYYRGEWDQAVELYERGRLTRLQTGDAVNAAFGTCNVGEILSDQGRLAEAEPRFREALRVWQAAGDRPGVAFVTSALGRLATRAGRPHEAHALLQEARAVFEHVGARGDVVDTQARIAECLALHGRPAEALELADEAVDQALALAELRAQLPLLQRARGWALAELGERDEARAAFEASLDAASRRQAQYELGVTLDALARAPELVGSAAAAAYRREADPILTRLGVVKLPAPAGWSAQPGPADGRDARRGGRCVPGAGQPRSAGLSALVSGRPVKRSDSA